MSKEFRSNDSICRMDIALCLCNVNFFKVEFLVYDASFKLYSVLLSDIMGVIKLCINRFDNKSYS